MHHAATCDASLARELTSRLLWPCVRLCDCFVLSLPSPPSRVLRFFTALMFSALPVALTVVPGVSGPLRCLGLPLAPSLAPTPGGRDADGIAFEIDRAPSCWLDTEICFPLPFLSVGAVALLAVFGFLADSFFDGACVLGFFALAVGPLSYSLPLPNSWSNELPCSRSQAARWHSALNRSMRDGSMAPVQF